VLCEWCFSWYYAILRQGCFDGFQQYLLTLRCWCQAIPRQWCCVGANQYDINMALVSSVNGVLMVSDCAASAVFRMFQAVLRQWCFGGFKQYRGNRVLMVSGSAAFNDAWLVSGSAASMVP
jgi:hypothetical protein